MNAWSEFRSLNKNVSDACAVVEAPAPSQGSNGLPLANPKIMG
jgi:hypothetical protein